MEFENSKAINLAIAENVRAYIDLAGIGIGEFEKSIGKNNGYISRICNTGGEISLLTALRIANILDVTLDELVTDAYQRNVNVILKQRKIAELEEKQRKIQEEINALRNSVEVCN